MSVKILSLFVLLLIFASTAFAEEKEKEARLEEIVVTATKTPHTLEDVPVETTLITKEEIENSNVKNVSEILRYVPGFYIL